jgi:hypothetical protein
MNCWSNKIELYKSKLRKSGKMFNNRVLQEVFDNVILDKTFVYSNYNSIDNSSSVMEYLHQYTDDPRFAIEMYKFDYTDLVKYVCDNIKNPACLIVLDKLHKNGFNLGRISFPGNHIINLMHKDNIEAIKLILKYYPDCLVKTYKGLKENPFDWPQSPEAMTLILEHFGDKINEVDENNWNRTPLIYHVENVRNRNDRLSRMEHKKKYDLLAACFKMMIDNGADPNIENKRLLEALERTPDCYKALVKPMLGLKHIPTPTKEMEKEMDKEMEKEMNIDDKLWDYLEIEYIVLYPDEVKKYPIGAEIDLTDRDVFPRYDDVSVTPDVKYIAKIRNDKILEVIKLEGQPEMEFLLSKSQFGYQVTDIEKVKEFIKKGYISSETFKGILVKSTHYKPSNSGNMIPVVNFEEYKDLPHKTLAELGIITDEEYNLTHFTYVDKEIGRLSHQIMGVLNKYKDTKYMKNKFPNLYGDFTEMLKQNKIDLS